jgi:hypothetical protein
MLSFTGSEDKHKIYLKEKFSNICKTKKKNAQLVGETVVTLLGR